MTIRDWFNGRPAVTTGLSAMNELREALNDLLGTSVEPNDSIATSLPLFIAKAKELAELLDELEGDGYDDAIAKIAQMRGVQ